MTLEPRTDSAPVFDEGFRRRLSQLSLVVRRVSHARGPGERRSSRTGPGLEFADYRDYSVGDDYRHIDWNAFARMGRLLLRLYEQPSDAYVYLLVDCSSSMALGAPSKLAYAKRLAAALAYVVLAQLDRVSVLAFSGGELQGLPATRSRSSLPRVLDFLQNLQPSGTTNLAASVRAFVTAHHTRGVVIVISDLYDRAGVQAGLDALRHARFDAHVLQLTDASELDPTLAGEVELCDAETGARRTLVLTPALRKQYARAQADAQARLRRYCRDKRVALFQLDTSIPAEDAMLRVLRRGGMLR